MKRFIVRYKVKPGRAQENQDLIKKVFAELKQEAPAGVSYAVFKGLDGVTFVHIVSIAEGKVESPISRLTAFKAFQAGIRDRCDELPVTTDLEEVSIGSYGF
jgi:hypothetical protein